MAKALRGYGKDMNHEHAWLLNHNDSSAAIERFDCACGAKGWRKRFSRFLIASVLRSGKKLKPLPIVEYASRRTSLRSPKTAPEACSSGSRTPPAPVDSGGFNADTPSAKIQRAKNAPLDSIFPNRTDDD